MICMSSKDVSKQPFQHSKIVSEVSESISDFSIVTSRFLSDTTTSDDYSVKCNKPTIFSLIKPRDVDIVFGNTQTKVREPTLCRSGKSIHYNQEQISGNNVLIPHGIQKNTGTSKGLRANLLLI